MFQKLYWKTLWHVVKIPWDVNICIDHTIYVWRPDFVAIDKAVHAVSLVDISIPADPRVAIY